jgi:hypothetical protein
MIIYALVGLISYYGSIDCFIAFFKNGTQKTWTTPDTDILIRWIFGKKHVSKINNLIGGIFWLICGNICTVLFFREL